MAAEGTIPRAMLIIRALAGSEGDLSIQELAESLGLPTSTVHRILQMLRAEGMAEHDLSSRRYRPGPELLRVAAMLGARHTLDEGSLVHLQEIVAASNENAQFGVLLRADLSMMFTQQVQSSHSLRFNAQLFEPKSLLWGCSGRVIAAYLSEDEIRAIVAEAGHSPVTGAAPPALADFERTLAGIRERGWDTTRGEKLAESVGFAAPVFSAKGIVGSISMTIPAHRFDEGSRDEFVRLVTTAATAFGHELGAPSPAVAG